MAFSLTKDIRSVTELKRNTKEIIDQVNETGRPVVITVNGKPDVVIIDARVFEEKIKLRNLSLLLETAEKDIAAGRTRSTSKFFKEFKNAKKI